MHALAETPVAGRWTTRLAGYAWRRRPALVAACGASLVLALATAAVPVLQRVVVDDVIVAGQRSLGPVLAVLGGVLTAGFVAAWIQKTASGRLSLLVQHDLRTDMFRSLMGTDGHAQARLRAGNEISRVTSDLSGLHGLVEQLPSTAGHLLMFALAFGLMLSMSPLLTCVALLVGPVIWLVSRQAHRRLPAAAQQVQRRTAEITEEINGAVVGVRVVKAFVQERRHQTAVADLARRLFDDRMGLVRARSVFGPLLGSVSAFGQVAVLAVGGGMAVRGTISVGTFLAFSSYLSLMAGPVRMLAGLIPTVQQCSAAAERVFQLVDTRPRVVEAPDAVPVDAGPVGVRFEDVGFGYEAGRLVLDGLSLTVRPGEILAVVGPPGAGKSTLLPLLTRHFDATRGAVLVGERDVRCLTLESLRSTVGVVAQDSFLFADTVRANLAHGRPDATEEDLVAAARVAQADEFVERLPDGYETVVGEAGHSLSGGQRQRIALARTLLATPRVLLLDDATAAVDPRTEADILAGLREFLPGTTTLIITQRGSALALADRVAVLDQGRLTDIGTLPELEARSPLVRALVAASAAPLEREAPAVGASGTVRAVPAAATAPVPPQARASAPNPAPAPEPEPDADPEPVSSLRPLLSPLGRRIGLGLALVVLASCCMLALPLVVRAGIDAGIQDRDLGTIAVASLCGLVVVVGGFLLSLAQIRVTGRTGELLLRSVRVNVFAKSQRLGLDVYEREGSGRVMTRMTVDVDTLAAFLQADLSNGLSSLIWAVGASGLLLAVDPRLGMVMLAAQPLLLLATLLYRRRSTVALNDARSRTADLSGALHEHIGGLRLTQLSGSERRSTERFARLGEAFMAASLRAQRQSATYLTCTRLIADVTTLVVIALAAHWIGEGAMTVGTLAAFLLYIGVFLSSVQNLAEFFEGLQRTSVSLRRVDAFLRLRDNPPPPSRPAPSPARLAGRIELDRVRFAYPGTTTRVLREVSLTIRPGQTVVLAGRTGAGKSTLVKLLARFYDADLGAVRADGWDVRDLDLRGYRRRLAMVPQESFLFSGTVADNISYGRAAATPDEIEAAARAIGAHAVISALPDGYGYRVAAGGGNLSAGQRQLIALARAQLVDPDVLLIDEGTAALDPLTERTVTRALLRLARDRTTVIVAHRLSAAAAADRVVVIEDGRVAEQGRHEDLLLADGPYARLWRARAMATA